MGKVDSALPATLGHYRIVGKVGSGGMGQVYRARDERLDREVAIKVLPPDLLAKESARRRFRREALALSRLNHPNIAIVHDFDSEANVDFLVMELVEGTTLESMIGHGPLSEREVIRVGQQIARALEEAHEKGVIHRDLKPANVMVTAKGAVKVLDFGLAGVKEIEEQTETRSTKVNLVAGTPRYLAPELLSGKPANPRSDIWALGVTLYEMAAARSPFGGASGFELYEAIMKQEPAPLGSEISPSLRTVIGRCLAKSPEERYQNAGELRAALDLLCSSTGTIAVEAPARTPTWVWFAGSVALVAIAVAISFLVFRKMQRPTLGVGGELALLVSSEGRINGASLSPDGKMVAYVAEEDGHFDLFLNRAAGGGRVRLTNDSYMEGGPSFSPDGERIAFGRLRSSTEKEPEIAIIPILGGEVTTVVSNAGRPRWSPDGKRLAYIASRPGEPMSIGISNLDGQDERILLKADDVYPFFKSAEWSPDGTTLAVTRSTGGVAGEIWLVPTNGGAARRLWEDPPNVFSEAAVFTPDGKSLVYASNRGGAKNLWVRPVAGGEASRVTTGAGPDETPSVARDGTVSFTNSRWKYELLVHDINVNTTRSIGRHTGFVWAPAFSPNGRQIAYSYYENMKEWHIWITAADGNSPSKRLTAGAQDEIYPRFSPDGSTIVFCNWPGRGRAWRVPAQGGPAQPATAADGDSFPDISPDGKWIAFARNDRGKVNVYVQPFSGGEARKLTPTPSTLPRWSPDGKSLLFCADRSYRSGVWIIRADGIGERRVVSIGSWAVWWPDGKSIAYVVDGADGNQEIRVTDIENGTTRTLKGVRFEGVNYPIDISRDGRLVTTSNSTHLQDEVWILKPQK
ncbi:MAG TPA: protein kinase [Terriglobales bacterium]|nr:protein kinase [Terriglobales bacterium]